MSSKTKNLIPQVQSEQELQRYFEAIIESSDDAIITKNLNSIVQSWNPAAQRIFGYAPEEIIGKSITILIPEGHANEEPEILARLRNGQRIDHYETIRRRKDGTLLNVSLTVSPIKNAQGQVIGASKIARDVTNQKRTEAAVATAKLELAKLNEELEERVRQRTESLNQAVAQMEEFSYSVSHDLRSPVRAMQAYASAVLEDYGSSLDATANEYLRKIVRSGARMDKLIVDLLTYSKIARDKISIQSIALGPLIEDIIQHYPEMQPPRAEIKIHMPIPSVMAHEPSLMQAVSNLLSNAVKFVGTGVIPKIEIRAEEKGPLVRLWVEDNGIGITPELRSRIFGMFERMHQDARYEGTGIGLAIVRKGVERMGGHVGIEPNSSGTGSAFWIELPRASTEHSKSI